jgi:hypothetical protein
LTDHEPLREQSTEERVLKTIGRDYYLSHRPAHAVIRDLHPNIFRYIAGHYHRAWPPADRGVLLNDLRFTREIETPMLERIRSGAVRVPRSHVSVLENRPHEPIESFVREWHAFANQLREAATKLGEPPDPVAHAGLLVSIASGIAQKDMDYQTYNRRGGLGSKTDPHASYLRDHVLTPDSSSGSEALDAMHRGLSVVLSLDPSLLSDKSLLERVRAIWLADATPAPNDTPIEWSPTSKHELADLRLSLAKLATQHERLRAAWHRAHPDQQYRPEGAEDARQSRLVKAAGFVLRHARTWV